MQQSILHFVRRRWVQIVVTAAGGVLISTLVHGAPPKFEAFWQQPPKVDLTTLLLWQFDEESAASSDTAIGDLETTLKDGGNPLVGDMAHALRKDQIGYTLTGDARLEKTGRFGGSLHLAPQSALQSRALNVSGDATLDFWIKPEPGAADLLVCGSLRLVRSAAGALTLFAGNELVVTHPRSAPDGTWTHIAVVWHAGGIKLLVNGRPVEAARRIPIGTVVTVRGPGAIDAVRLSQGERLFFELDDSPRVARVPVGPPYFVFAKPATNAVPPQGTLEFWFRPVTWNNLAISAKNGADITWIPVLRFGAKGGVAIAQGRWSQNVMALQDSVVFQPGQWTHVLCVWDRGPVTVFLNGQPQPISQVRFELPAADRTITPASAATEVDQVHAYPWTMTAVEVGNAYARFSPSADLQKLDRIHVTPAYDYNDQVLKLYITCLPVNDRQPATVTLHAPVELAEIPLDPGLRATATVQTNLDFGTFPIQAESRDAAGKVLATVQAEFTRSQPAWWQNTLGKDRVVPPPWTPITVDGATVTVWDRKIKLGSGGLPASLLSSNVELFSAAPRLVGLTGATLVLGTVAADRVSWTGVFTNATVQARVSGVLEYDGLLSFAVTLSSATGSPVEVPALVVEFPLAAATELIVNGGGPNFRAAWNLQMLGEKPGTLWNSRTGRPSHKGVAVGNFCPVVWLGNDERGICFYGENDRGWTPNTNAPAQEVVREGAQVIYRMNVINEPVTLAGPRTFTFVLQATPTKPLPPGWRAYNRGGVNGSYRVYDAIDAFVAPTLTAPTNAPGHVGITFQLEPPDWVSPQINANQIREHFGKGSPVFFYIDASWPKLGPTMDEFRNGLFGTGRLTWSREVEDYLVWIINEYLRRGIIDGIYIDDSSLGSTRALFSTAYLLTNGQTQPGFSSLGYRRFLQRVWTLFTQAGKTPQIMPHMTYCFEVPALSFATAVVNGEDRDIYPYATHTFMDVWGRDELRIMGSSPKWGFINFWKPGVAPQNTPPSPALPPWLFWQSRAMHALAIPHDYWYTWLFPTASTINRALLEFGMADPELRFIPYWKLDGAATASGQSLMLSIYAKPRRALLVISNPLKEEQEVTVTVDPEKLFGVAPGANLDWTDIDSSLIPPVAAATSAAELKKLNVAEHGLNELPGDNQRKLDEGALRDFIEGDSPMEKEQKHLALHPHGNELKLVVRKQDFRLIEVTAK